MKFKNIKKKAKNIKSPSNSRSITDKPHFSFSFSESKPYGINKDVRGSTKNLSYLYFYRGRSNCLHRSSKKHSGKASIDSQRNALARDLNYWENFISEHQDYRDAYIHASILEYKTGGYLKRPNIY